MTASHGVSDPRRRGRLAALVVLVASCAAACWVGTRYVSGHPPAGLVVAEKDLDIGEVWEQEAFPWKLTISNNTKQDIEIERFLTSCGCISIEPASLMIPAGKQAPLQVTLNLTQNSGDNSQPFNVDIRPLIGGQSQQTAASNMPELRFTIHGRTRRLLRLSPGKVSFFGKKLFQGQTLPSKTVVASPTIPLDSLNATCPSSLAIVEVARPKEHPDHFELKVTPRDNLPVGPFHFDVRLEPVSKNARYPDMRLPVEGQVSSDVQATPDSLVLGERRVGETVVEMITLRSESDTPFEVINVQTASDDTVVEPATLSGIHEKAFRVAQKITKPGKQSSSARFSLRSTSGRNSTVIMKVIYLGASGNAGQATRGPSMLN